MASPQIVAWARPYQHLQSAAASHWASSCKVRRQNTRWLSRDPEARPHSAPFSCMLGLLGRRAGYTEEAMRACGARRRLIQRCLMWIDRLAQQLERCLRLGRAKCSGGSGTQKQGPPGGMRRRAATSVTREATALGGCGRPWATRHARALRCTPASGEGRTLGLCWRLTQTAGRRAGGQAARSRDR